MSNREQENPKEIEPGVLPREYTESDKAEAIKILESHPNWQGLEEFSL